MVAREIPPAAREPRGECLRCWRPLSHCYCALIPRLTTTTKILFLQHPRESDVPIGTARMAHLALVGSTLVEGIHLDDHAALTTAMAAGNAAVLFPGDDARPLEAWLDAPPTTLIVLDGTWWQAQKLLKENPKLAALPRLSYRPPAPGNYRIRKEPSDEHLATVEAVAAVVGALEGDPERFAQLLRPFTYLVDRQVAAAAAGHGRHKHPRARLSAPLAELATIRERPERAVILYAEANCHPRGTRVPGAPEVLHLVAGRPFGSEALRFEAVLRPRRPLGDNAPHNLGLSRERFESGEDPPAALARFRAFLGDDANLCAWGSFARDLLVREGEPARGFIDLRALTARALGRQAGGIGLGAAALGAGDGVVVFDGRAGRMLAHLEGVLAALLARFSGSRYQRE